MLKTGDMGGKCADINSLFVGLARAAGLPARDFFGIRVADSGVSKSLGKSGDITKAQHCRAEVFIDGKGWFPVDPADVRKVVLEEEVPLDSDKVKALRERLFGNWEMNWVGFNYARDFVLPGQKEGPIGFLMYPYAETPDGSVDSPIRRISPIRSPRGRSPDAGHVRSTACRDPDPPTPLGLLRRVFGYPSFRGQQQADHRARRRRRRRARADADRRRQVAVLSAAGAAASRVSASSSRR